MAFIDTGDDIKHHDFVIKWEHFPRYWPFVRRIHWSPVNSPHKGQWRGALMFSLICARINGWVNNGEAGDLRRHRAHYDVIVMGIFFHHVCTHAIRMMTDNLCRRPLYVRWNVCINSELLACERLANLDGLIKEISRSQLSPTSNHMIVKKTLH